MNRDDFAMNVSGKVEGCDSIIRFYFISKHCITKAMVLKTTSKSPSFRCTMGYQIPYLKPVFRSHLVLVNLFTPTLRICNIRLKIRSI